MNVVDPAGWDGFLGTRASLMLDVIVVTMLVILPILGWSIYQVKYRRSYSLHKTIQLSLAASLFTAVVMFELDMRINGWRHRASPSPYYGTADEWGLVQSSLAVHLVFAISTVILWAYVIVMALLRFPSPPVPNYHSRRHIFWARLAAIDLVFTALTGWVFYYLAFVAAQE